MPSYEIRVPNDDEGETLGEYQADYLPRVGDPFVLWHPRVCRNKDEPFCAVVSGVTHESVHVDHPYNSFDSTVSKVTTVVWLTEEHAPPTLYCDCSEAERAEHPVVDGACDRCGHVRSS